MSTRLALALGFAACITLPLSMRRFVQAHIAAASQETEILKARLLKVSGSDDEHCFASLVSRVPVVVAVVIVVMITIIKKIDTITMEKRRSKRWKLVARLRDSGSGGSRSRQSFLNPRSSTHIHGHSVQRCGNGAGV